MPTKDVDKNREYQRRWYEANKDLQMERNKIRRQKVKDSFHEYKSSNPCTDCGNFFISCVMEFDHIDDNKEHNIARLVNLGQKGKAWNEIEKCELVCANCHRVRSHNRTHNHR